MLLSHRVPLKFSLPSTAGEGAVGKKLVYTPGSHPAVPFCLLANLDHSWHLLRLPDLPPHDSHVQPSSRGSPESPAALVETKGADKGWVGAAVHRSKRETGPSTECLIPAKTRWAVLEGGHPALPRLPMPPARAPLLLLSFNMLCSLFSSFDH